MRHRPEHNRGDRLPIQYEHTVAITPGCWGDGDQTGRRALVFAGSAVAAGVRKAQR